jgi:hypothetical protein
LYKRFNISIRTIVSIRYGGTSALRTHRTRRDALYLCRQRRKVDARFYLNERIARFIYLAAVIFRSEQVALQGVVCVHLRVIALICKVTTLAVSEMQEGLPSYSVVAVTGIWHSFHL